MLPFLPEFINQLEEHLAKNSIQISRAVVTFQININFPEKVTFYDSVYHFSRCVGVCLSSSWFFEILLRVYYLEILQELSNLRVTTFQRIVIALL